MNRRSLLQVIVGVPAVLAGKVFGRTEPRTHAVGGPSGSPSSTCSESRADWPTAPEVGQVWYALGDRRYGGVDHVVTLHSCDEGYPDPLSSAKRAELGLSDWHATPGERWWAVTMHQCSSDCPRIFGAQYTHLREHDEVLPMICGQWRYLGRLQDLLR